MKLSKKISILVLALTLLTSLIIVQASSQNKLEKTVVKRVIDGDLTSKPNSVMELKANEPDGKYTATFYYKSTELFTMEMWEIN